MNKCLVTTLKAQTNNEALSKYNVLTIKTKSIDSPTVDTQEFSISTSENGTASINSSNVGLYLSGISGELVPYPINLPVNGHIGYHFENKDGIIEITGKYNLREISIKAGATVRIKEIYGIPATIDRLLISNIEEREIDAAKLVKAINCSKLTTIYLPQNTPSELSVDIVNKLSKNTVGNFVSIQSITTSFCVLFDSLTLDDLANNVNITGIVFYQLKEGNLSSLAKLTKLATIVFSGTKQNNGDIIDFINPWIQAGRTSGKIRVQYINTQSKITLNGSPLSLPSGVADSNYYLNWTSDGTVTFTAS